MLEEVPPANRDTRLLSVRSISLRSSTVRVFGVSLLSLQYTNKSDQKKGI
jgi:hypothetical protein